MKIGELAKRTGLNASAIRYYEARGLLAAPHRVGGQRRYPDDAVYRVRLISYASAMGFTLGEIRIFLNGLRDDAPVGPRWKQLARRKLGEVARNIERELRLKSLLEHMLRCRCASLRVCVEKLSLSENLRRIGGRNSGRGSV
ncbi:MAG TPA: MerR family transcriptional regulator [Candidatus Baltobacteraceae bacterium]|nr:MerR family transcriptional regulator [Candidatus Baltobacteraceae bacterium]